MYLDHVCIYKNDELVECNNNVVTNAGRNHTRDLLTPFSHVSWNSSQAGRINGSQFVSLSQNGTDVVSVSNAGYNFTDCSTEVTTSGLGRSAGTYNNERIQTANGNFISLAVGNFSISNLFTATGTVNNINMTCLFNSTSLAYATGSIPFAVDKFATVNLNSGDTINITWFIGVT